MMDLAPVEGILRETSGLVAVSPNSSGSFFAARLRAGFFFGAGVVCDWEALAFLEGSGTPLGRTDSCPGALRAKINANAKKQRMARAGLIKSEKLVTNSYLAARSRGDKRIRPRPGFETLYYFVTRSISSIS
jgi:hypothetical protein